jgi:hypothetical protein
MQTDPVPETLFLKKKKGKKLKRMNSVHDKVRFTAIGVFGHHGIVGLCE